MRLRLGLVGLSNDWNQRHLPALRLMQERFEVCGIYNTVASFADRAASEFGARRYDGFREMLASDDVDAVLVLEEGWFGLAPIEAACEFGKAVYCGNEIEIDPKNAETLKDQVESSGVAFMAEFPRRLAPATLRLKELIATRLGQPEMMFCHMRLPPQQPSFKKAKPLQNLIDREMMELIDWLPVHCWTACSTGSGYSSSLAASAGYRIRCAQFRSIAKWRATWFNDRAD